MGSRRAQTKEWEPWYEFSDDGSKVTCVFCHDCFSYKRARAFAHMGYKTGVGKTTCTKVPPGVKRRFASCGGLVPSRMTHGEEWASASGCAEAMDGGSTVERRHAMVDEVDGGDGQIGIDSGSHGGTPSTPQGPVLRSRGESHSRGSVSLHQQQMAEALCIGERNELDDAFASFFYEANIPFNVIKHPSFVKAVKLAVRTKINYSLPSYHNVRTKLLERKRKSIEAEVKKKTSFSIKTYGVTLCMDGWDNVVRRPLMNVMMSCPVGDVFLGSLDTTGNKKSANYIATELKKYIEEVVSRT